MMKGIKNYQQENETTVPTERSSYSKMLIQVKIGY